MATPATHQDLEGAMNTFRAEIAAITAPQIAASITVLRNEIGVSVTAALVELRQHIEAVDARFDARFQHAATGFSDEQERLNGQLRAGQDRLTATQSTIEETLARLNAEVETAVAKMAAVSDG